MIREGFSKGLLYKGWNQSHMELEGECSRHTEQRVQRWKGVWLHVPTIEGHLEWGEAGEAGQVRGSQVRQRHVYHGKEFGFYSIDTCSLRASDCSSACTFSLSYPVTTAGSKDKKSWEHSSTSGENINWELSLWPAIYLVRLRTCIPDIRRQKQACALPQFVTAKQTIHQQKNG